MHRTLRIATLVASAGVLVGCGTTTAGNATVSVTTTTSSESVVHTTAVPAITALPIASTTQANTATTTTNVPVATNEAQTTLTAPIQASGVDQNVSWQNLFIPLPPNAVWEIDAGANTSINGAAVLERGSITYPNATGVEQPYGPAFLVLRYSGTLDEWLDLERRNDTSTAGNGINEASITDRTIAGLPARAYRRLVTGTGMTEYYALRLDETRLLWITTDDAENAIYQSVIDGLRMQAQ